MTSSADRHETLFQAFLSGSLSADGADKRLSDDAGEIGNMAAAAIPLAIPTDETDAAIAGSAPNYYGLFGSAHPNVVNFLFGDCSVRSLSVTTPAKIPACLGTVNDGETVSLP